MFDKRFRDRVTQQKQEGLHRNPPVIEKREGRFVTINGRRVLSFASNDYLGLGASTALAARVGKHFNASGAASASSSRLVAGNYDTICQAEKIFADYFGYDDALFFSSGYQANLALLSTLFENGDALIFDKHVHASSVKGMALSNATLKGYRHNCLAHLEKRLKPAPLGKRAVVTESLFSMDGDILPVEALGRLKEKYGFYGVVDEAHGFGVLGDKGRGIAKGVADVALGTFGKALGLFGAFVLLPHGVKEYLMNFASPFIYTTALPPAHALAAVDALELVEQGEDARKTLNHVSIAMHDTLTRQGFQVFGDAHILSILMGDEERAVRVSQALLSRGIFTLPARYPTVPLGKAILRLGMTALHRESDIHTLVNALKEVV
ncbi:MAG: aminotransferase class I/II-fold pyridoxal phosphate-dependent enzyme [Desulfobacterium sp.]|nr:aminotransferase class I/II-fold pyridoxal phosphate-dependent enzyme [Desulfobacterium sp.]